MYEYEIYLPLTLNDGTPVADAELKHIKQRLTQAFGGYTHLRSRTEGAWKMAGATFHDEITILRVLASGEEAFDWPGFQTEVAKALQQEEILIVKRRAETL